MNKLDLVILTEDEIPEPSEGDTRLRTEEHKLEDVVEKLGRAWPILMEKLERILEHTSEDRQHDSDYELESVQFQIGIEGGFTFGFTGTANAAITATFSRPK